MPSRTKLATGHVEAGVGDGLESYILLFHALVIISVVGT